MYSRKKRRNKGQPPKVTVTFGPNPITPSSAVDPTVAEPARTSERTPSGGGSSAGGGARRDLDTDLSEVEHDPITREHRRAAYATAYVDVYMIAPPAEWEGCDGTINSIVRLLNVPQGSRWIVKEVVADVYQAYTQNREWDVNWRSANGGLKACKTSARLTLSVQFRGRKKLGWVSRR